MATKQQHAQRCCDNYRFQEEVAQHGINSNEWRVIVLFYSALQAVDAFLAGKGIPTSDHSDRGKKLNDQIDAAEKLKIATGRASKAASKAGDAATAAAEAAKHAVASQEFDDLDAVADAFGVLKTLAHSARYLPEVSTTNGEVGDAQENLRIVCEKLRPRVGVALAIYN